jgi:hypothetical protein
MWYQGRFGLEGVVLQLLAIDVLELGVGREDEVPRVGFLLHLPLLQQILLYIDHIRRLPLL